MVIIGVVCFIFFFFTDDVKSSGGNAAKAAMKKGLPVLSFPAACGFFIFVPSSGNTPHPCRRISFGCWCSCASLLLVLNHGPCGDFRERGAKDAQCDTRAVKCRADMKVEDGASV